MGVWVKGQSGNPRGRPSHARIAAALKPHEKAAIDCLVRLVGHSRKDSVSLQAAQTILAYIHGKPVDAEPPASGDTVPMLQSGALDAAERLLEAPITEAGGVPADSAVPADAGDRDAPA